MTTAPQPRLKKYIPLAIFLILLIAAGWYYFNFLKPKPVMPVISESISQSTLEEKYGLRINLVAVTGAGGFVDLRLKMVDGAKAKLLLGDVKNFPSLFAENGVLLKAPADTISQKIEFTGTGNLFIMYPNSRGAVKKDAPVIIVFGNIALEPIQAK